MNYDRRAFLCGNGLRMTVTVDDAHQAITSPPEPRPGPVKIYSRKEIKQLERKLRAEGRTR